MKYKHWLPISFLLQLSTARLKRDIPFGESADECKNTCNLKERWPQFVKGQNIKKLVFWGLIVENQFYKKWSCNLFWITTYGLTQKQIKFITNRVTYEAE